MRWRGGSGGGKLATTLVRPGVSARQVGGRIRIRVTGRIVKAGASASQTAPACNGTVTVRVTSGGKRRASKRARIRSSCKYATTLSFRVKSLPKRLRPRQRRLLVRVKSRYNGTTKRRPDNAPSRLERVRR